MRIKIAVTVFVLAFGVQNFASATATMSQMRSENGGTLWSVTPKDGSWMDSHLFMELHGGPYEIGLQHGLLLADEIASLIAERYSCSAVTPDILLWMDEAYSKMPWEFQQEILGIADGLTRKGYRIPFSKVVMHSAQVFAPPIRMFPWFNCPDLSGTVKPKGSFSYAVWGAYVRNGGTLAINSPDFGMVAESLTRYRVIFSIRPSSGHSLVFLGVAGIIGFSGMNDTGLATAATAGQLGTVFRTPIPGDPTPIPMGFMTLVMTSRHILQYFAASELDLFGRIEREVLVKNPIDGFITQVSAPGRSAVWESGGSGSRDYPFNSRRMPGEGWDSNAILPIDRRGWLALTQFGIADAAKVNYTVAFTDSLGGPYSGTVKIDGQTREYQARQLGRAFARPKDAELQKCFEMWFQNLGSPVSCVPMVITGTGDANPPDGIMSTTVDKTGGWWMLGDGSRWGIWRRNGSTFRASDSNGMEFCAGTLYDFGNGIAGWCPYGNLDIEWVAWTHQYPQGAEQRLDGMNLSVLPQLKPYARLSAYDWFLQQTPHGRTHAVLHFLGEPQGTLTLEEFYNVFQRAYLSTGAQDDPFGVSGYDLENRSAMFTMSRYMLGNYLGGLNPAQKPIILDRYQLFGF